MSKLKVNATCAPDFSYRLVARKFNEAKKGRTIKSNLDLSSIVCMLIGAKPILECTKDLMADAFSDFGFNLDSLHSGYGLAESVVFVSSHLSFQLSKHQPLNGRSVVAVGHRSTLPKDQIVKVVFEKSLHQEVEDGLLGEIWLSGPSVTTGYFGRPSLTEEVFKAQMKGSDEFFLRTGDQGFFEDDYLYICGRLNDLIIVNGVNYYPKDIEAAVEIASSAVRPGCVAAFVSIDGCNDVDTELEVVFEIRDSNVHQIDNIMSKVNLKVVELIGLTPKRLAAIKERTIMKTTSGKIQRSRNCKALHENKLDVIHDYFSPSADLKRAIMANTEVSSNDKCNRIPGGTQKLSEKNSQEEKLNKFISEFCGDHFDGKKTWEENGVSSIHLQELRK